MTKPRYQPGCAARSQDCGRTSDPADYAWYVNFDNGNSNWNHQNNEFFVRAVRSGECQGAVSLQVLHAAWRHARAGKKPSANQLHFDACWIDRLLELDRDLAAGTWRPARPTCFIAKAPKAREIHAPDFGDRVVHHWLVPQLEQIYERRFIHDSFSNRRGKGTHVAVERLRHFVRAVHSGQGGGWYLQLDIHNFFNSIHRPTLYALLKHQLERHSASIPLRRATHALLRHEPTREGVRYVSTAAERALVPAHKQLANAARGCGIAIGNLSSQFFANVYLDELDQFVKHTLKAKRYIRYVDDFLLVHESREQLQDWLPRISSFLQSRLRLSLKSEIRLRPLTAGVDFLGYVVFPTHTRVRRRVVGHARAKLAAWARRHVRHCVNLTQICAESTQICATPAQFRQLRSIWSSYSGHFAHANSARLRSQFHRRFPWLRTALLRRRFDYRLEGLPVEVAR